MALMLYEPPPIFDKLYATERNFTFAEREIKIRQDWTGHGVAAVVWDAAVVLSLYLETLAAKENVDKRVLEIGAGTGLAGIVGCLLGFHVTITDRLEVLHQTIENVERNVPNQTSYNVTELEWGKQLGPWKSQQFDIIMGADVVYIKESFPHLLETLLALTEGDNSETTVLLSCRIRYEKDEKFIRKLRMYFNVDMILHNKDYDVKLYRAIRRKNVTEK